MVVEIVRKPAGMGYNVFFFEAGCTDKGKGIWLKRPTGIMNGRLEWERIFIPECSATDAVSWELNEFELQDLSNALDKLGVKSENDFKLQGKVDAMKEHLQDLRKMLKLV